MALTIDQMNRIVWNVALGAPAPDNEPQQAADFRASCQRDADKCPDMALESVFDWDDNDAH